MIVFLWTDMFIWLLFISIVFIVYKLRVRPDFQLAAKKIFASKSAVLSMMILAVYLSIGLLDSMHFRYEIHNGDNHEHTHYGEVNSILDYLTKPWSIETEKTFSAPFADSLYVKERMVVNDGKVLEVYPLLEHVQAQAVSSIILYMSIILILVSILMISIYKLFKYFYDIKKHLIAGFIIKSMFVIILSLVLLFYLFNNFHVLGTDKIGQDILYVTIKSIRTGLVIGSLTTIFMLPLAILFGTAAGYYGGIVDDVIQYIYTTLSSIPGVLLISALILIIQTQMALHPDWFETIAEQADIRLLALCIILGITSWSGLCRLIRAETLKLKQMDYVTAAITMRVNNFNIILRHIVPNLVHIIIINLAMGFSGLVLAEAVLSYIGVGVDPTTMSWGNMINSARLELSRAPIVWWPIVGAFIPMFTFVLALNIFADKLRDAFDPRTR